MKEVSLQLANIGKTENVNFDRSWVEYEEWDSNPSCMGSSPLLLKSLIK